MINIGICDDELCFRLQIREILENFLSKNSISYTIHEFSCGEEILGDYPKDLDILVMDINMKSINGMDTARKIREFDEDLEIIFMTSFAEFMQEGYEVKAYRYILKPINESKILENVLPCIDEVLNKRSNYITINTKDYIHRIKIDSIVYIETDRPNILIHTLNNTYATKMNLSKMEKLLSNFKFFRCHNSYIINLKLVDSIGSNTITVNNNVIPVSRHRVKNLKIAITNMLGDTIC